MKKIETFDSIFLFLHEEKDINILSNRKSVKILQENNKKTYVYYSAELSKKKIIKKSIKYHNNEISEKIFARKCIISEIDNINKNKFLNLNHIQGTDRSNICYGAYYENKLIAVLTFDDKRTFNGGKIDNEYELSRFATDNNYVVIGIFPKMLNKFIVQYKPTKITTFANKRWTLSKDNIYSKNGFKLTKTLPQDYLYYKNGKLLHKFNLGKSQIKLKFPNIFNENKTESELAKELGYVRIWDCGKYKYQLFLDSTQHVIFGFIYKITNLTNNKVYIGQTTRELSKRIGEYKKSLLYNNINSNQHLYNSFKKYEFYNFKFEVIDTAKDINELNEKEINYIQQYKSNQKEFGYNIELGGRNAIPNTETLERMSRSHIGIKQTNVWIDRRIAKSGTDEAKKYGKIKTEEEREYLSANSPKYWLGKNRDDDTKKKISKTKKLLGLSDKQKTVLCKKVYKINTITNNIIEYDSTQIASIHENVNQSTISRWCKNEKIVNNFRWKY